MTVEPTRAPMKSPLTPPVYPRYMLSFCFGYFVILTNLLTLLFCDQNSRGHRTGRADSRSVLSLRSSAALSSLHDRQSCCRAPREPGRGRPTATTQWWGRGLQAAAPAAAGRGCVSCDLSAGPPRPCQRPCPWRARLHLCFCGSTSRSPLRKGTQEDVKKLLASLKCPSVGGEFGGA